MTIVADLHAHTTVSDGTMTLDQVPAIARAAGVDAVAITDHDRYHPEFSHPVERRDGVVLVRGIELRVDTGDQRLDLLGYGLEPTEALTAETERIQQNRIDRGRRIIENIEEYLGVDLDLEPREGLGRPHIARAVIESDADYDEYGAVFDDLIGNGGPCYVAREVPSVETGVSLLREACAVVGLAHPLRYPDPEAALDIGADLDAVELYYPYDRPVGEAADDDGRALVEATIEGNDLLATGGTDAHEEELGVAGLPQADWDRIRARLPDPVDVA